jgi:hypothetical protein
MRLAVNDVVLCLFLQLLPATYRVLNRQNHIWHLIDQQLNIARQSIQRRDLLVTSIATCRAGTTGELLQDHAKNDLLEDQNVDLQHPSQAHLGSEADERSKADPT